MIFSWDFLLRIIIAASVTLIGSGLFNLNFLTFPKHMKDADEEIRFLFSNKTDHWTHTCQLLGFLFFAGDPLLEGRVYSLPMFLRNCLTELGEMGIELVLLYTFPFVAALIYRSIHFSKWFGMYAVRYIWFRYIMYTGIGMLIGLGFELLGRLIGLANPTSGSFLYFVFFGLIICQIIYIGWNAVHFVTNYFFSFFSKEALENMAVEIKTSRMKELSKTSASDSGSGGDCGLSSSSSVFSFPSSLDIGGENYRLEYSDNEKANYYCSRTGDRIQVRKEDLET